MSQPYPIAIDETAALVRNTSTTLQYLQVHNPTATTVYVKLFNQADDAEVDVALDEAQLTVGVPSGASHAVWLGRAGWRGLVMAATTDQDAGDSPPSEPLTGFVVLD